MEGAPNIVLNRRETYRYATSLLRLLATHGRTLKYCDRLELLIDTFNSTLLLLNLRMRNRIDV